MIVDHGDGYFSVSGHLAEIFVAVGDSVDKGDTLGSVGETGSLTGPGLSPRPFPSASQFMFMPTKVIRRKVLAL